MSTSQQHQPSPTVRYEVRDGVAVIRLANPPVNGLGDTVRAGLDSAVARAAADDHIRAVIIVGEGKGFCGGADLRQFGTPAATADPTLPDVLTTITHSPKPVIAAIHGYALGGGLELALACHYRITHRDAKLGLPEVNVGLIPGGGGTQRLPRLIGAAAALRMIQQGTPVSGTRAAELGIADDCFDGDPLGERSATSRTYTVERGPRHHYSHNSSTLVEPASSLRLQRVPSFDGRAEPGSSATARSAAARSWRTACSAASDRWPYNWPGGAARP
ncbi:enoyl-CoA hydratase/isomerase family protein [Rhodococcus wratislaviensis]|uniref:Enoyl-CoA hydratase n=1 Tax=Rhodococcus wratislaviensis NBRC 100605 TaxID=1219028 RepID=X0Q254_RHOWR|nr:enoyl-CoA hydratase/isomerase family protein [Rhodococcus wratislaviensis]GAF50259.1 enoyl-CoA hydratase [Rhodococcus wratislaviensis NBRC 100605]